MEIEILNAKSGKHLATFKNLASYTTVLDVKEAYKKLNPSCYLERQSFRTEPKGKSLKDNQQLQSVGITNGGRLYFKDLGPQIGWTTVFLTEYAGPLFTYLIFYVRPAFIYGPIAAKEPRHIAVQIACACWVFHYAKRLLETVFVHRFSNATMPIMNIFKNSSYYWGFAAFIAYFVNHPLYTPALYHEKQIYGGLAAFIICELGNYSIHIAFRNLRPPGTKARKIPYPTSNPFTLMFNFVSCPNYTYEVGAWVAFSILTQCLPAALFTVAGFYQMAVWAQGKHRNYKREFEKYPKGRKAIIPFVL